MSTTRPNQSPSRALPKGRVLYSDPVADAYGKAPSFSTKKGYWHTDAVAVIPARSLKHARAILALHGAKREELVERMAKAVKQAQFDNPRYFSNELAARAALSAILPEDDQ